MINPAQMMKAMGLFRAFQQRHPKAVAFFQHSFQTGIPEGTILEMTITKPGEPPVTTNLRVQPEDLALFRELQSMNRKGD